MDLGLYQYGWEQCKPLHSYGPCTRNRCLFHYYISDIGILIFMDSKSASYAYQIRSGEGFLIYPKQIDTYLMDKNHPWEYTRVEFDGLRVREALELIGLTMDAPVYHSNVRNLSLELKNEMLYIAGHPNQSSFHLIGHLYLLLDYLTRSSASRRLSKTGRLQDSYIREAASSIKQNFQNDISVGDIAAFCNLSHSYPGGIPRDAVGKSPQKFLISCRMTKTAELLKLTELPINDINNAVGYPGQPHLSRAFKKTYSIPPRRQHQENKMAPVTQYYSAGANTTSNITHRYFFSYSYTDMGLLNRYPWAVSTPQV